MSEIERAIEKKEYIERGAALELFWEYSGNWNLINAIPDADVEEVVHGKWEDIPNRYICTYGDNPYRGNATSCSVCHDVNPNAFKTNYCPNCGAKMDGEKEGV